MRKKTMMAFVVAAMAMTANAQDIYKVESLAGEDLNGTARYVGMGGAMSALGADISVMGTNPAGIGLYRRSDIAMTGSVGIQPDAEDFFDRGKARASFDNMGFVYAARLNGEKLKFVNIGFNYHKRRNMKNFVGINGFRTGGLSQSLQMLDLAYVNGWLDLAYDEDRDLTTPLTNLGYDTQMLEPTFDSEGNLTGYNPVEAESYNYKRVQWGGTQQYDFNLSFNWNDRVYAGFTFGVYNVNMHSYTDYAEMLPDGMNALHEYYALNEEELTGSGFDFKAGVIFRPIEDSPFRVGLSVHSPTFYSLSSNAYLYMNAPFAQFDANGNQVQDFSDASCRIIDNSYQVRTPWKFNISAATTVGTFLALDAEYEFCDYSTACIQYNDYDYDDWGNMWGNGVKDKALGNEIKRFLKPVSTFRIGAEARLMKGVYGRVGYNRVSAPIKSEAYLNLFTDSPSYFYSTNTDYINLGATNRVTCGLGMRGKHFYADLAYQYQKQDASLYTFHVPEDHSETNRLSAAPLDLKRHNVMLTLGYKF